MSSKAHPATANIEIARLQTAEDALAFRTLNEEWITRYFELESKDREILNHPESAILQKGGHIFMVRQDGEVVGCVALILTGHGVYELSKMAVAPRLRGQGVGRRLLEYVIAEAEAFGAKSLFLASSTKLGNAVHLYESVGFRHLSPEEIPPIVYARSDVFMELALGKVPIQRAAPHI